MVELVELLLEAAVSLFVPELRAERRLLEALADFVEHAVTIEVREGEMLRAINFAGQV